MKNKFVVLTALFLGLLVGQGGGDRLTQESVPAYDSAGTDSVPGIGAGAVKKVENPPVPMGRALQEQGSRIANFSWQAVKQWVLRPLFHVGDTPVTPLGLIRVLIILIITWFMSKALRKGLARLGAHRNDGSRATIYAFSRLLHYVIMLIGAIVGLSSLGMDFTKLALLVSALGVGIGFGLQNIVGNFVSGLIILFEKSLKVGDFVELESGVTGVVRELNMRSARITTNDNLDIIVPNSEFVNTKVVNWTLSDAYRRTHIPFGVAYGSDKEKVKKAVLEAADKLPHTLKGVKNREPEVWLVGFGDSSLNFELVVWLRPESSKRPRKIDAEYTWEIESALRKYEIEIPFPQRDLHMRSMFGVHDEQAIALVKGKNGGTSDT